MRESGPGYSDQSAKRMIARVVGVVCMAIAVVLVGIAIADFFRAFNSTKFGAEPTKFWLFFAALPFFVIGAMGLNAGFLGVGARYAAGELAPTARDTLAYVREGEDGTGCPACGARNPGGTAYCDNCGAALRRTCPSCEHPGASDAKFCAACGAALSG